MRAREARTKTTRISRINPTTQVDSEDLKKGFSDTTKVIGVVFKPLRKWVGSGGGDGEGGPYGNDEDFACQSDYPGHFGGSRNRGER